jgi:hypothetical protein
MRYNKLFFDKYMKPAMENHKVYVISIYPSAHFMNGYIYDGWKELTETRWDIAGFEAEYYAWMWAYQNIGVKMLEKLES